MRFYAGDALFTGCVIRPPLPDRPGAPAIYFASDTGDDYFEEFMQEHEVWKNRKTIWEKVSQSAVNDFGDCEKIGLVQDWCVRMSKEPSDYVLQNRAQVEQ